jgi:ubiquinone/menaquinone biosynthesis C-methylase UbiE
MDDKKFSGVIGEEYDLFQLVIQHHDEFQAHLGEIVSEFASKSKLEVIKVVEIGSGTGITTKVLLDTDPRMRVVAIDNEPKMEKSLASPPPDRVEFILDDALKVLQKMEESSVDVVASCYTIHNMPINWRASLFKEIYRVLRPCGIVVNADKIAVDDESEHQEILNRQLAAFVRFKDIGRADLYEEWYTHYNDDESVRFTEAEQVLLLKESGLTNIQRPYRQEMEAVFVAKKS